MKNWKKVVCGILLAGFAVQLAACASAPMSETEKQTEAPETVSEISDTEAAIAAADFSVALLQNTKIENGNCILSPYSIMLAMAMTANGADGETLAQMESAFGMPMEAVNQWLSDVHEKSGKELISANSIWLREEDGFTLSEDFVRTNEDNYQAQIQTAPFNEQTLADINGWVSEYTKNRIPKILDSLDAGALMVLLNALTFDAAWQNPYTENDLTDGVFFSADGENQKVTMMSGKEQYYLEDGTTTGFVKDYEDGRYRYVVLLPEKGVSAEEYIASLSGEKLLNLVKNASEETVKTQMPAYKSETFADMSQTLQAMGITDAFSPLADFSKMGNLPMNISQVLHKTYLKVHSGGTEAAAATAVIMTKSAKPMQKCKEVIVDRPYVMAIMDQKTDAILFLGAVNTME